MYSSCYTKRPLYGYGSPLKTHGVKNEPPKHHTEPYEFHNKLNTSKNRGTYGQVKDPFKAYRNSKHHVVDMTKYYDRKDPFWSPKQDYKTEMTFRRFRPKSANVLVKDRKVYTDPSVNPHFIYNRNIYEEYRSSLGSRQRLDGSVIDESRGVQPDDSLQKSRDQSLEKKQKELEEEEEAKKKKEAEQLEKERKEEKKKEDVKREEDVVVKEEKKKVEELKKEEKKVPAKPKRLRSQRPQSAYIVRKPRQSKGRESVHERPQAAAKDEKKKLDFEEKPKVVQKAAAPLEPVQEEIKKRVEEKETQVNKVEIREDEQLTEPKKEEKRGPVILVTSEYRRSFSPPAHYVQQPPVYHKVNEDKQAETHIKHLSKTTYRADFSPPRAKKQYRNLQSLRPAGVCSILGMVTYN